MGIECLEGYHKLDAVTADKQLAAALKVNIGAPLLSMTRVLVDKESREVVAVHSHYRADRYYTLRLPIAPQAQQKARTKTERNL